MERIEKPWGYEIVLKRGAGIAIKELHIKQGEKISVQSHVQKNEVWMIAEGPAAVVFSKQAWRLAQAGEIILIPAGTVHCVWAKDNDVVIWEMQHGSDDDIIRYYDKYGRQ